MNIYPRFSKTRIITIALAALTLTSVAAIQIRLAHAQSNSATEGGSTSGDLIGQFRRVEVASVSDALEQVSGKKMYMSHRMQPIFTAKFAGYARTVQLKRSRSTHGNAGSD